jgi:hypothetical protein
MVHYVGWCPEVSRHLGIMYSCYLLSTMLNLHIGSDTNAYEIIEYAGAKKCTAGVAIEQKLTISASKYLGLSGAVVRGNRDRAEFVKYAGYLTQIEFARTMAVVSYRPFLATGFYLIISYWN